jgi:TonB-linked SusC/RagA family outer membrane protein
MKLTFLLLTIAILNVSAHTEAQTITLSGKNITLKKVFSVIKKQTGYVVFTSQVVLSEAKPISVSVTNMLLTDFLDITLKDQPLNYKIADKTIILTRKPSEKTPTIEMVAIVIPPPPTVDVTVVVQDSAGQPLEGASIKVKGTQRGITTDANGHAVLKAIAPNSTLVISFTGYGDREVAIGNNKIITIKLTALSKNLDDIVVIGYGTIKTKDVTGSIATVSSKDFQKAPVINAEGLIANKIPGLQVIPSSGKPGSGSSMLIRGGASLNASTDPLIVIDGVALEGWDGGPGMLSQLNPNDIETFTILKDASAAAIYGARASNGVILITTKKGQGGRVKISFNSATTVSSIIKEVSLMTGDQFRAAAQLATALTGNTPQSPLGTANTNWQKEIYHTALAFDNNLSFSGLVKNMPYRLSLGFLNQNGVLKTGNFKRGTVLLNLDPALFARYLKINISVKGSYEKERVANETAITSALSFDPSLPIYDASSAYGKYYEYTNVSIGNLHGHFNPVGLLNQVTNYNTIFRSIGNIQVDYRCHFLPDLHVNVNTGYDVSSGKYSSEIPANAYQYNTSGGYKYIADPAYKTTNSFLETYLNYTKDLPSVMSHMDIIAGYSYNNYVTSSYNYPTYNVSGTVVPSTYDSVTAFNKPRHLLISFYSRLNYAYKEKYLLTATIRRDGSSRFSEKNRWGTFPSAALAWKMKEENFLKNNKTISALKLRLGYGITGQQDGIGNYDYIPVYYRASTLLQTEIGNNFYIPVVPSAYDETRKWEQTATTNIGVDFGVFNNRITGSLDLYYRNTSDLLNTINVPQGTNFTTTITKNIGSMENKGVELTLNAQPVRNKSISWDLSFNIAYNENKITKLSFGADSGVGLASNNYLVNTVGYPRNTWYLYHQVYDKSGNPLEDVMLDANKDGVINNYDLYRTKSAAPKFILGVSTNLVYKKWSAGFALHADLGQYLMYSPSSSLQNITGGLFPLNISTDYYKTKFYRGNIQYEWHSDYYLQNASFLKMDNAYIGYNIGKIFRSFHSEAALRVNVSVQHVFTITGYSGQDPEAGWNGGWQNAYPIPRIYAFGVNLDF